MRRSKELIRVTSYLIFRCTTVEKMEKPRSTCDVKLWTQSHKMHILKTCFPLKNKQLQKDTVVRLTWRSNDKNKIAPVGRPCIERNLLANIRFHSSTAVAPQFLYQPPYLSKLKQRTEPSESKQNHKRWQARGNVHNSSNDCFGVRRLSSIYQLKTNNVFSAYDYDW